MAPRRIDVPTSKNKYFYRTGFDEKILLKSFDLASLLQWISASEQPPTDDWSLVPIWYWNHGWYRTEARYSDEFWFDIDDNEIEGTVIWWYAIPSTALAYRPLEEVPHD